MTEDEMDEIEARKDRVFVTAMKSDEAYAAALHEFRVNVFSDVDALIAEVRRLQAENAERDIAHRDARRVWEGETDVLKEEVERLLDENAELRDLVRRLVETGGCEHCLPGDEHCGYCEYFVPTRYQSAPDSRPDCPWVAAKREVSGG